MGLLNGTKRFVDHVMLDIEGIANKGSLSLVGAVIINTVSSTYCKRMILFPKSVQIANKEAARKIGPLTKTKDSRTPLNPKLLYVHHFCSMIGEGIFIPFPLIFSLKVIF